MILETTLKTTERERDVFIAKWMGWTDILTNGADGAVGYAPDFPKSIRQVPQYAFNYNDLFAAEEEIAHRNFQDRYVFELQKMAHRLHVKSFNWFLVHATLEQRQVAFYNMLKNLDIEGA